MSIDYLREYRKKILELSEKEKKLRNLELRKYAIGEKIGPLTGYPSLDKPWLKWYTSEYIGLDTEKTNAYDYFLNSTIKYNNMNLISYYGKNYTRQDIINEVEENVKRLTSMGLRCGDTVTLLMLDVPEVIFLWYAMSKMGIITNMIKFDESPERIKYMTKLTKSKFIFVSEVPFMVENINTAVEDNLDIKQIIAINLTDSLPIGSKFEMLYNQAKLDALVNSKNGGKKSLISNISAILKSQNKASEECKKIMKSNQKFISYPEWKEKYRGSISNTIEDGGDNISAIVYTGGTTGNPKGVQLTNNNLNAMVHAQKYGEYDFLPGKKSMNILPPAIAYFFNATHGHICLGVNVDLISHFTVDQYPYLIKEYEPNIFMSGPILLEEMRKADTLKSTKFVDAAISGGDKLFEEEEKKDQEYFLSRGAKSGVHQGYGMSECTAAATYSKTNAYKLGSVGIPFINIVVSIFDYGTDKELKYGEVGEICITGPTLMYGYLFDETNTKGVLKMHSDGKVWLHTDDLGYMDEEGRLFHKGRAKRMLTRSGNKVWLTDIEDIVSTHPDISSCCCVKMGDEKEREVPVIHVVFKDKISKSITEVINELNKAIKDKTDIHYVPKYYIVRDSLLYTELNKKCDYRSLESENIFNENEYTSEGNIIYKKSPITLKKTL